jgi:hypothetical protein
MRSVICWPRPSFWSTRDGDAWGPDFGIQGVPKLEPSEATHTRAQRRGRAFALAACSKRNLFSRRAALLRLIMPSPFCLCAFAPKVPRFALDPRVRSLWQAGLLPSLFFLAFVYSRSLCCCYHPPFLDGEPELSSELRRAGSGASFPQNRE